MDDEVRVSETKLLYDPLFAKKPDVEMKGGKNLKFKIFFVIIITIFVGISLYFSFNSISTDKYTFKETDAGWQLYQFNGGDNDYTLHIDYVRDEDGVADESKPVSTVREFSMSCNEYVQFIFIGKSVTELEPHCFYYTKNLKAVIVDPENEYFTSVDGVLYSKDMTEIILCPIKNYQYKEGLAAGLVAPTDEDSAETYILKFNKKYGETESDEDEEYEKQFTSFLTYEIPETVTKIADSCFSDCDKLTFVKIPEGVKEIGSLAFFKCKSFETISIPDGVESIGSDGFSYCEKVTYIFVPESVKSIGHHAFFGCLGCEKIYMGAKSEDEIETGDNWLPRKSTKSLKNIEVVYGQERRSN